MSSRKETVGQKTARVIKENPLITFGVYEAAYFFSKKASVDRAPKSWMGRSSWSHDACNNSNLTRGPELPCIALILSNTQHTGVVGTGACMFGAFYMFRKHRPVECQWFQRGRVAFQFFTVGAIMLSFYKSEYVTAEVYWVWNTYVVRVCA
jgi:hypothetical protein